MKNLKFMIILFLLVVILFSLFKYASDEEIIENMSQGRFMIVAAIINDNSSTTSDAERIAAIKSLNLTDAQIKKIIDSSNTDSEKVKKIKDLIQYVSI